MKNRGAIETYQFCLEDRAFLTALKLSRRKYHSVSQLKSPNNFS